MPAMTFHECFGELPKSLLTLIRKHNVSPADYYFMEELYGEGNFEAFRNHILGNVTFTL